MKNHKLAWQNLSNFAQKKDINRTFAMFKLLGRTLKNPALKSQLEADLHLAFNQKKEAIQSYTKAAQLYLLENQQNQAIAIYTHLKILDPKNIAYPLKLVSLYFNINNINKIKNSIYLLKNYLSSREEIQKIRDFLLELIEQNSKQINQNNLSDFILQFLNTISKS